MSDNRPLLTAKHLLLPLGLIACGAMAVVTALGDPPEMPTPAQPTTDAASMNVVDYSDLGDSVEADFQANELLSDSAPQQQVVASWAIKDLARLLVSQSGEASKVLETINDNVGALLEAQRAVVTAAATVPPTDDRMLRTIMWAVIALCWLGMWSAVGANRHGVAVPTTAPGTADPPEGADDVVIPASPPGA